MSIASEVGLVEAIREAVVAVRRDPRLRKRGWYDSHSIVNYLDAFRNEELNRIIDLYADCQDPPHRATIQIGCFLQDHLGQSIRSTAKDCPGGGSRSATAVGGTESVPCPAGRSATRLNFTTTKKTTSTSKGWRTMRGWRT